MAVARAAGITIDWTDFAELSAAVPLLARIYPNGAADVIVTAVTMALHVAIALEKPVILFNNIFNGHEFYLYGRGEILEPGLPCQGCYKPRFDARCPVSNCMDLISSDRVLDAIDRWRPGREAAQS